MTLMLRRESQPGGDWTDDHVAQLMVDAFRLLPGTPVYSSRSGLKAVDERLPPGPPKVINWTSRYLEGDVRKAVLVWASTIARGDSENSLRSVVESLGWPWSTFKDRRKRGCEIIAERLNKHGIEVFHL